MFHTTRAEVAQSV